MSLNEQYIPDNAVGDHLTTACRPNRLRRRALALMMSSVAIASACSSPGSTQQDFVNDDLVVASWNVEFDRAPAGRDAKELEDIEEGIRQLLTEADIDIIGLQEVTQDRYAEMINEKFLNCDTCTYDGYFATRHHGSELPIIWKEDEFDKIDSGKYFVQAKQDFTDDGAGDGNINDRYIVWVALKRISGDIIIFADTHILPSNGLATREKYYNKHINVANKFMSDMNQKYPNAKIIVVGDMNRDFRDINTEETFNDIGLESNWKRSKPANSGTHNGQSSKRLIDTILSNGLNRYIENSIVWPDANGSDHQPVVVTYRLNEDTGEINNDKSSTWTKNNFENAIHIGDSIAVGLNEVDTGEAGNVENQLQIGASPSTVYKFIKKQDVDGKEIILSTGILNNMSQAEYVEKQLVELRNNGARRVLVVGVPTNPKYNGLNKILQNEVKKVNDRYQDFAVFMGGYLPGNDGIHPEDYKQLVTMVN